jgi:hypothetical protein
MAASTNDKFRRGRSSGRPQNAYLTSPLTAGATTASVSTTTGWATDTGTDFIIFLKDATTNLEVSGTRTTWKCTVSGTTLNNLVLEAGTVPVAGYPAGEQSVVIATPTAAWSDDLVTGLLVAHEQTGALKTNAVPTAAIQDSAVTTAKVNNAAITPDKLNTGIQTAAVNTQQTTTSTTYTDLATVGPAVTVTIGANGIALVILGAATFNSGSDDSRMSFVVSGANTLAADNSRCKSSSGAAGQDDSKIFTLTGLNPGSTTFTAKYLADSGTAGFLNRTITVIPL